MSNTASHKKCACLALVCILLLLYYKGVVRYTDMVLCRVDTWITSSSVQHLR